MGAGIRVGWGLGIRALNRSVSDLSVRLCVDEYLPQSSPEYRAVGYFSYGRSESSRMATNGQKRLIGGALRTGLTLASLAADLPLYSAQFSEHFNVAPQQPKLFSSRQSTSYLKHQVTSLRNLASISKLAQCHTLFIDSATFGERTANHDYENKKTKEFWDI
ncbi:hypothetical protein [Pseudomonas chlororaphis]|uniref:hypothetical protein n=1 Tax=Pseudomonas chlororaphis TaxID=587753 RepID=UPI001110A0FE|nr:hypothetical protein [Pseudomonas chlororaphis]